jgi:hypothetical protein
LPAPMNAARIVSLSSSQRRAVGALSRSPPSNSLEVGNGGGHLENSWSVIKHEPELRRSADERRDHLSPRYRSQHSRQRNMSRPNNLKINKRNKVRCDLLVLPLPQHGQTRSRLNTTGIFPMRKTIDIPAACSSPILGTFKLECAKLQRSGRRFSEESVLQLTFRSKEFYSLVPALT